MPLASANRKTIVFAVPDFEPGVGGTTRQVGHQARALRRRGHEVIVLTRRLRPSLLRHEVRDGLPVFRVGPAGHGTVAEKQALAAVTGWLARNRRRIAVLHPVMWTDCVFGAAVTGLLRKTAVVWAIDGEATAALLPGASTARRAQGRMRKLLLERCAHVVLTEAMAAELATLGLRGSTSVIPVPVDPAVFRPPSPAERSRARARIGASDDTFVAAYVGHLQARKAVNRLVEAFGRLVAEDAVPARLLLVGGGRGAPDDTEPELRAQVGAAALTEQVAFCGVVPDPRELLWAADVFVLPSFREGMPNSLLEAMACGLPCIAPPAAGGRALITPERGFVPPSNDPADLLASLRAATDPASRARMGRAGVAFAAGFDVERIADAYERLHARLTASSGN